MGYKMRVISYEQAIALTLGRLGEVAASHPSMTGLVSEILDGGQAFYDLDSMIPDDFLKSMYMSQAMRQSGIDVMKWLPYEFIKIDGHNAMKVRYYRKGIGSDKEVYCENYTISISDYKSLNIIFSYQSVYATRYAESFRRMMQSISIYF